MYLLSSFQLNSPIINAVCFTDALKKQNSHDYKKRQTLIYGINQKNLH